MKEESSYTLEEAHVKFAKQFNGKVWELLELETRIPEQDEELLLAQSASFYHWRHVGTEAHEQRGLWLFSRIHTVQKHPEHALDYARRCLELTQAKANMLEDFDHAYAREAMARALALNGDLEQAHQHYKQAVELGNEIADPEDREIFQGDLRSGDWYGIQQD